jgi:NADP-dependent aldehyde dehydrogenase
MLLPIGPVAVFAASNFPFAFSTAGGDTASALAAGCPVIVKAHSSHLGTNELVANAIIKAAQRCNMPDGVFSSLVGEGSVLGQSLAKHPVIKAVGFTGSFRAGMALFKTANERNTPIPVYAEMSSINPILILPDKLEEDINKTAAMVAGSITLGVGQFCTNPGLLFLLYNATSKQFIEELVNLLKATPASTMLNQTICKSYYSGMQLLRKEKGVTALLDATDGSSMYKASASLMQVSAKDFTGNKALQNEVFGPSSLIILCDTPDELLKAVSALHGQLTGTVIGTEKDAETFTEHISMLTERVGRLVFNGVPTGVEVSYAMVHGGPFPATTDARSTSVGADAIKRFVRPVCFQDCPSSFLPQSLKNENASGIMRKVNGKMTRDPIN